MNHAQAVDRLITKNKTANKAYKRIVKWNEAKTMSENASQLFTGKLKKTSKYVQAFQFAQRYKLGFKKVHSK